MQYKPFCGESTLLKKLCKYVTNSISCHSFFGFTMLKHTVIETH